MEQNTKQMPQRHNETIVPRIKSAQRLHTAACRVRFSNNNWVLTMIWDLDSTSAGSGCVHS